MQKLSGCIEKNVKIGRKIYTIEQLTLLYHQKCEEYGFSMKRRDTVSVVPRKLRFLNKTNDIDKEAMPHSIQVEDDKIHQEVLKDLQEKQYISRYFL
jgi:hypothetical protein